MSLNIKSLERSLKEELMAIAKRCARLRDRDTRLPEEILGYDNRGLPG